MSGAVRLLPVCAFMACSRVNFTFFLTKIHKVALTRSYFCSTLLQRHFTSRRLVGKQFAKLFSCAVRCTWDPCLSALGSERWQPTQSVAYCTCSDGARQMCEDSVVCHIIIPRSRSGTADKCAFDFYDWSANNRGPFVVGWPVFLRGHCIVLTCWNKLKHILEWNALS
jgi:hypothetical protein